MVEPDILKSSQQPLEPKNGLTGCKTKEKNECSRRGTVTFSPVGSARWNGDFLAIDGRLTVEVSREPKAIRLERFVRQCGARALEEPASLSWPCMPFASRERKPYRPVTKRQRPCPGVCIEVLIYEARQPKR
jgi:hypothetical protein